MNISIVDDEQIELTLAETYFKKYIHENWLEIETETKIESKIETFSSAKDFLNIFKPGMFQLVILDIRMEEINVLGYANRNKFHSD